jgi:hypothetical protein
MDSTLDGTRASRVAALTAAGELQQPQGHQLAKVVLEWQHRRGWLFRQGVHRFLSRNGARALAFNNFCGVGGPGTLNKLSFKLDQTQLLPAHIKTLEAAIHTKAVVN